MARMASSKTAVRGPTRGTLLLGALVFVGSQHLLFGRTVAAFVGSTPVIKPGPFGLNDHTQGRAVTRRRAGGTPPGPGNGNWEPDQDASDFLQELARKKWQDTKTRPEAAVKVLPLKKRLLTAYGKSGLALFSRNTTRMAWSATFKLLEDPEIDRVVILGRPGIGKSRSLFYGLRDLLCRADPPRVIIFEARRNRAVFRFAKDSSGGWKASRMSMRNWDPGSSDDLRDPENWHLIDAGKVTDIDGQFEAKCVKASSPDPDHWSDFNKDGGTCTYMGDWTLDEVEAAYPDLKTEVGIDEIRHRHELVGGNLRLLLGKKVDFNTYVGRMNNDVRNKELVEAALDGVLLATPAKIATRLFTYATSDGIDKEVVFVTPQAIRKVVAAHYKDVLKLISIPGNPKAGFDLEDFVTKFFLVGGLQHIKISNKTISLDAWELKYTKNTKKNTKKHQKKVLEKKQAFAIAHNQKLHNFDTEGTFESAWKDAVKAQDLRGEVWQAPPGYPAFDVLIDYNHAISITKSSTHSLSDAVRGQLSRVGVDETNFTFTFLTMQDPTSFEVKEQTQWVAAQLTKAGATVQVVQIPRTPKSIP